MGFLDKFTDSVEKFIQKVIYPKVDQKMRQAGQAWVSEATRLVPVDTGQLRDSIGFIYDQDKKRLTLYADKHYAVFVEFGTRFHRAQPFMRPALRAIGKGPSGVTTEVQFTMIPEKYIKKAKHYTHSRIGSHKIQFGHRSTSR